MIRELYRSANIVVRSIPAEDRQKWVVTFDNHSIGHGFDRDGFSQSFLVQQKISAIHILGRGDDWYQYEDIFDAAEIVRGAVAGAERRLAYGSSMGGYAGLRLATAIGANAVLALSPQWTVDPRLVPWETRWGQDARRIEWRKEFRRPLRCDCRPVLVFDPRLSLDLRHISLIAGDTPSTLVPVPYGGHPVSTFLAEVGLLGTILKDVLNDRFCENSAAAEIRKRKSTSFVYLGTMAERQPAWRPKIAVNLARLAAAASPSVSLGTLSLARVLAKVGEYEQALALHRDIIAAMGRIPLYLVPFAETLLLSNQHAEAVAVANEVIGALPNVAHLRNWRANILWTTGAHCQAIAEQKIAISLDPGDFQYRQKLLKYQMSAFRNLWRERILSRWRTRASGPIGNGRASGER